MNKKHLLLLPGGFRLAGFLLIIAGTILGVIRFRLGLKPQFFDMKPFAIYSNYIEPKIMQFIGNNMSEEFVGAFLLCGLFMVAFSRDKIETEEKAQTRNNAFYYSAYMLLFTLLLLLFFTYGFGFVYATFIFTALPFLYFIVIYRSILFYQKYAKRQKERHDLSK